MWSYISTQLNGASHNLEETTMAYNLIIRMGAAYVGAVAVLTLAAALIG